MSETLDNIYFDNNLVLVSSCVLVTVRKHIMQPVQNTAPCENQDTQQKLSDQ